MFALLVEAPKKVTLISTIVISVILLVCLTIAFVFAFVKDFGYQKKVNKFSEFNIRIYTYDYARKTFHSFDRMNLTNIKDFDEDKFLSQFIPSDTYRIKSWLEKISTTKDFPTNLQVVIKLNRGKREMSSLLRFVSINKEKHIIHFESQLLPYMHKAKIRRGRLSKMYYLNSVDECKSFLASSNSDVIGSITYFMLYTNKPVLDDKENKELENIRQQLTLTLSKYLDKTHKIRRLGLNDIVMVDISSLSKLMAMHIATTIQIDLQQCLNVNMPETFQVNIAIGLSIGTLYHGQYTTGEEQSKKMAAAMRGGKAKSDKVLLYDESFFNNYEAIQAQKEEIRSVIKTGAFRLYYTPTIDVESGSQSFYFLDVVPYGTSIDSIIDVMNVTMNIRNGPEMLFGKIYKKVLMDTSKVKDKVSLAIEMPYGLVKKFLKILDEHESKVNWIFCIKESELVNINEDPNLMMRNLRDFKKRGVSIALIIDTLSSNLRSRVLKQINYFFVSNIFSSKSANTPQFKDDLRTIKSQYSPYKVPLVFYGLSHTDDIETGVMYGGRIFQCDEVGLPSSRLEKIDAEVMEYLLKDAKSLIPERIQFDLFDMKRFKK